MKRDWNNIKKQLLDTNYNKSVLLGNGFTIACGNNNILNSEKIIDNVHKYFRNRATTKKIASIEAYIYEVEKQFIKQIYNILPIDKIKKLPNLENIIEFLNFFDKFYTLNYDHVLYCLLMILHDRGKEIDDGFRKQKNEQFVFIGDGAIIYKDLIKNQLKERAIFIEQSLNYPRASLMIELALEKEDNIFSLEPHYISKSQAERERESKS